MTHQQEQAAAVAQFRNSLSKVVDLGYGDDECDNIVMTMFVELVRDIVPCTERDKLSFTLPLVLPEGQNTHAHLLKLVTEFESLLESEVAAEARARIGRSFLFPFLTTLGVAGGMFLIAVHVARLAPFVFGSALSS